MKAIYVCRICGLELVSLPADATKLGTTDIYRFANNSIHDFYRRRPRPTSTPITTTAPPEHECHIHWNPARHVLKSDCVYCVSAVEEVSAVKPI